CAPTPSSRRCSPRRRWWSTPTSRSCPPGCSPRADERTPPRPCCATTSSAEPLADRAGPLVAGRGPPPNAPPRAPCAGVKADPDPEVRMSRTSALAAVSAIAAIALSACAAEAPQQPAPRPSTEQVTALRPPPGTVVTANSTADLGTVVADGLGFTLYRFDGDSASPPTARCEGPCVAAWEPVLATEPITIEGL